MDTATGLSGHADTQNGHVQEPVFGPTGHAGDGHGQPVPDGEYLSLPEAAAAVQRSEKTVRRLVSKGKVPNYRESTPPYRMLVEMNAVRAAVAEGPIPSPVDLMDTPRQSGQPPTVQPGQPPSEPAREDLSTGMPRDRDLLDFLQAELDRLRQELGETRTRSRAELEAKEQRIEKLTDDLLAARRDAGKWEQAEEYRKQLYHDYIRLQSELGETKMQLKLLERNPLAADERDAQAVYTAPYRAPDGQLVEVAPPRRPAVPQALVWALLLLVVAGGSFGIHWMITPH